MDINYTSKIIRFEKELNALDKLIIDFTSILNKLEIRYVIVSGYVAIIFGRSRSSEDIDVIIDKISFEKFQELWSESYKDFECITTENIKEAYTEYLMANHAIRFSRKNRFIPNIELKFQKIELESWTLKERKEVVMNNKKMFISPIELQISFKLYLGSEKDIEDAKHLYELFRNKLDLQLLQEFNQKLNIEELFNKYLR